MKYGLILTTEMTYYLAPGELHNDILLTRDMAKARRFSTLKEAEDFREEMGMKGHLYTFQFPVRIKYQITYKGSTTALCYFDKDLDHFTNPDHSHLYDNLQEVEEKIKLLSRISWPGNFSIQVIME